MTEPLVTLSQVDIDSAALVGLPEKEEKVYYDQDTRNYVFACPHCGLFVEVGQNEVNCTIFRHAYFFQNTPNGIVLTGQLNPHAPKAMCDQLVKEGKIYGCGKPFKMHKKGDSYVVKICDYI